MLFAHQRVWMSRSASAFFVVTLGCTGGSAPEGGGELGDLCEEDADCVSERCLHQFRRSYCTVPCADECSCPEGYTCNALGEVCILGTNACRAGALSFEPSNISREWINAHAPMGDLHCDGTLELNVLGVRCGSGATATSDTFEGIRVYFVNDLHVDAGSAITIEGGPVAIVARGRIVIHGAVHAGWGFTSPEEMALGQDGRGPGGGVWVEDAGGEGGAHCTLGGAGGNATSFGGMVYGTPNLVPIAGGSSGAKPPAVFAAGDGGGAIQLIAEQEILIGPTGSIEADGEHAIGPASQPGPGGGSGGAVLLEAPAVRVEGTISANGGDGGAGPDGHAAGAIGSAQAEDGASDPTRPGGGGGGFGWIRINTRTGSPDLGAGSLLSPSTSTGCTTFGAIP